MVIDEFKRKLREEQVKRGLTKEARSVARVVLPLSEFKMGERKEGRPEPTEVGVRMLDGKPMAFFTDGSLRHAAGHREPGISGKALRRAMKQARRRIRKQATKKETP